MWSGYSQQAPLVVKQKGATFALRTNDDGAYEVVGDDMQMAQIRSTLQQVQQRYAYHKVLSRGGTGWLYAGRRTYGQRSGDPHDRAPLELIPAINNRRTDRDGAKRKMYYLDLATRKVKELVPNGRTQTFWGDNMLVSRIDFDPHVAVPEHKHPHEQFGVVLSGEVTMMIAGEPLVLPRRRDVHHPRQCSPQRQGRPGGFRGGRGLQPRPRRLEVRVVGEKYMNSQEIEISILPDGKVEYTIKGVKGQRLRRDQRLARTVGQGGAGGTHGRVL